MLEVATAVVVVNHRWRPSESPAPKEQQRDRFPKPLPRKRLVEIGLLWPELRFGLELAVDVTRQIEDLHVGLHCANLSSELVAFHFRLPQVGDQQIEGRTRHGELERVFAARGFDQRDALVIQTATNDR